MKKFKFEFDNGEVVRCEIPENWEEMTVKQSIALNLKTFNSDPLEAIERLSGVEKGRLRNHQISPEHKDALLVVTNFLAFPPDDLMVKKPKKEIVVKGIKITLPKKTKWFRRFLNWLRILPVPVPSDLQKESFGQYVYFQQFADQDRALPMIMALYLQPLLDGDYGEIERIEELSYEVDKMLFVDVFPIVNFFFRKWSQYKVYGKADLIAFR